MGMTSGKQKTRRRTHFLFLPLSFFLVEVFAFFFLSLNTEEFRLAQLWPLAFGALWAAILSGFVRLFPAKAGRVVYGILYFVAAIYAAVQTGYFYLFSEMMWLSDFRYASEGSDYFSVLLSYPMGWWLGLAALAIGHRLLPHNPVSAVRHKFDKISAIANALTFGLLIYTLDGFAHAESRKFIAIQAILLVIIGTYFIRRQLKETTPILPVDLLKIPIFALSIGTSITSFTAQMLAMVSLPFFMQNVLEYNAVQIGLLLTPWPLATILTAPLAGRLVEKVHPGLLGGIGMAVFATGLFTLYLLPAHPAEWNIIWRMALCGMGFGLFQTPNNVTIVSSAPAHRSGGASGMLGTARLLGQTLGTTLVALLFRLFAEGHRAQACLLLALFFAIAAGVVSSIRMAHASPTK